MSFASSIRKLQKILRKLQNKIDTILLTILFNPIPVGAGGGKNAPPPAVLQKHRRNWHRPKARAFPTLSPISPHISPANPTPLQPIPLETQGLHQRQAQKYQGFPCRSVKYQNSHNSSLNGPNDFTHPHKHNTAITTTPDAPAKS